MKKVVKYHNHIILLFRRFQMVKENKKDNVEVKAKKDEALKSDKEEIQVKDQKEDVAKKKPTDRKKVEDKENDVPKSHKSGFIGDLNFLSEVRTDLPEIKSGDVLKISYRVIEGGKERIQIFEGTVIAIKNLGITKTITVRKTSFGISVERIFPLNSKLVQKIEVKKHSKVRRAKLYYLRGLKGKAARLKELR
jgi:large subunit ribosomal protein L19